MSTTDLYPPGPTNWRQSLIEIQRSPTDFLLNIQRTYGNFVHYRHGPAHCYLINEPDLIRQILVDDADQMSRPPVSGRGIGRFLGHGLLISSGAYHHAQRKAIQPIFTPAWIASYVDTMQSCVVDQMNGWKEGDVRDLKQEMTELTMSIIYRTVFGSGASHLQSEVRAAIETLQQYSGEMLRRTPQVSEADCDLAVLRLDQAIEYLITQRAGETSQSDLLSRLLAARTPEGHLMTPQQIRDEAVTLFVAGQETSANALTWLFYLLMEHPEVEARLRAANADDTTLQWVILEALRLYPPAWLIGRTPNAPYEIRGYMVQPGDSLVISPYVLQRTPELFPDPDQFIPERFRETPPKHSFLPFGAGPHVCIGQAFAMQEMTIAVQNILSHWHFERVDDAPVGTEPLITLQPARPILVRPHKIR